MARDITSIVLLPPETLSQTQEGDSVEIIIMMPQIHGRLDYIQVILNCSKYAHFNRNCPKYIYAETKLSRSYLY